MGILEAQSVWSSCGTQLGGVGFLAKRSTTCSSCSGLGSDVVFFRGRSSLERTSIVGRKSESRVRKNVTVTQSCDGDGAEPRSLEDVDFRREEREEATLASFSDFELISRRDGSRTSGKVKTILPPRYATLRAFGETGGDGVITGDYEGKSVFELLAANIEATAQVRNFEVFSGRLAMLAFFVAIGTEILTGNSVFKGIDIQKLAAVAALCAVATLSAASFAYVWRSKAQVASFMSKGYKNLMDSALDNIIDGIFFDEAS